VETATATGQRGNWVDQRAMRMPTTIPNTNNAIIGEPFEHQAKLKGLTQRQEESVRALDLTRNQASIRLDATAAPDDEEAILEKAAKMVRRQDHPSHTVRVRY
jgi:hypothetical protein